MGYITWQSSLFGWLKVLIGRVIGAMMHEFWANGVLSIRRNQQNSVLNQIPLILFLVTLFHLIPYQPPIFAANPTIQNLQLSNSMDGTGLLEITYDLTDADGDTCAIALQLSIDNGVTWNFPALNLSGDVGPGILPGSGKALFCNLGDLPLSIVENEFRAKVIASDTQVSMTAHSPQHMAVMDFGHVDWSDPENYDKFSQSDLLLISGSALWEGSSQAHLPIVEELKSRNSDLIIIGYVSGFSAKLYANKEVTQDFWYEWYDRTRPYWTWTTEGDTVQTWPGNVVIDITNPDCRTAMIETIMEYQNSSMNKLDGIYWDYFNNSLWVPSFVEMEGEIDMDGDGIPHRQDQDEMQAYRDAQVELVTAFRDSMGGDFLQIFNGQRAYGDEDFAGLADGVMYELYPTLFFPDNDMAHSLDPDYEFNLMTVRSWLRPSEQGPFLVMSNTWQNIYWDQNNEPTHISSGNQFRAVALLVDGYSCWNSHDGNNFTLTFGAPDQNITLGNPLGPPSFEDNFIRRQFQFGQVEIEMKSGIFPNPFDYRIWCQGQLVEELAIPFHFP